MSVSSCIYTAEYNGKVYTVSDGVDKHTLSSNTNVFPADGKYYRCFHDPNTGSAWVELCPDETKTGPTMFARSPADQYVPERITADTVEIQFVTVQLEDGNVIKLQQGMGLILGGNVYDVHPKTGKLTLVGKDESHQPSSLIGMDESHQPLSFAGLPVLPPYCPYEARFRRPREESCPDKPYY